MILKLCKLTSLLASVLLLSCNLDSDSTATIATDAVLAPGLVNGTVTHADGTVTINSLNSSVQVAWQAIPNASGYHIYYASEPITEFNNYAVFKDSKWLSNVTSPTLIHNLENQRYSYITVTAIINGIEQPIATEMAVTAKDIQPTNNELLQLELINQARKSPNAEAQRLLKTTLLNEGLPAGTLDDNPKQPLALNTKLVSASRSHSQWMLDTNKFSHTGANGSSPKTRMESAGYQFSGNWTSGENISWTGTTAPSIDLTASIKSQHEGLFRSPGHRKNLLSNNFREMGIGQILGPFTVKHENSVQTTTYTTSMLTNKFARSGTHFFLTGVAMKTSDTSAMYQPGNEYPEVILEVDGYRYAPYDNGHFSIALMPGTYTLNAFAPGKNWQSTQTVTITSSNIKWDLYLTEDQLVWVDFMAK